MISAPDLVGAMLGMLFLTLGLAAGAATALRSVRHDRTLLWFSVFSFLYGLRLITRSDIVRGVTSVPIPAWDVAGDVITYIILAVGALLASAALTGGWRNVLRYVWIVDLAGAFLAMT
jgi:hypothetical protein